jgi:hypothetical protein
MSEGDDWRKPFIDLILDQLVANDKEKENVSHGEVPTTS